MIRLSREFDEIRAEFDKYGPIVGEGVAKGMYKKLAARLAPVFLTSDEVSQKIMLDKLAAGEKIVGSKKKFNWLNALKKPRSESR